MKVDISKLEGLELYQKPKKKSSCIIKKLKLSKTLIKKLKWKVQLPRCSIKNLMQMPRWQLEGIFVTGFVTVICGLCFVAFLNIRPPDKETYMSSTTYAGEFYTKAKNEDVVKITYMNLTDESVESYQAEMIPDDIQIEIQDEAIQDEAIQDEVIQNGAIPDDEVIQAIPNEDTQYEAIPEDEDIQVIPDDEDIQYEAIPDDEDIQTISNEDIQNQEEVVQNKDVQNEIHDKSILKDIQNNKESSTVSQNKISTVSQNEIGDDTSALIMANVETYLNVRSEASADAEKVGVLYKDCGGTILEQKDEWTKIESGDVVGWAMNDYLLFDEDAQELADEVGGLVATVETPALNVRQTPGTELSPLGRITENDEIEVIKIVDDDWAEVSFHDDIGYVSTNYVNVKFQVGKGETLEAIKERKETAAKEKSAENQVFTGNASDLEMLATIIYCEAGNQPYEGKVAVGNVVINRVNSSRFPNTINEVIRAKSQFSPVGESKYDRALGSGKVTESCYNAARDAMAGINYVGDAKYFKNPAIAGAHAGITIGDHVFW